MSTPPPPGGDQPPYDPNQPNEPHEGTPGGYSQPGGYGQPPPPPGGYDPSGGYGQPGGYGGYGQPGGYGQAPPAGGYGQATQDHPRSMISLILGIVGIVCCSIAAPFAWVIGKKAVNEIDASGGRLGGRGQAQAGYILGIVGTVLLVLGLLFLILMAAVGGLSFEGSTTGVN